MDQNPVTASPAPTPTVAPASGAAALATPAPAAASDVVETTAPVNTATAAKKTAVEEAVATEVAEEIASAGDSILSPLPEEAIEVAEKIAESQNVLVALSSDPSVDEMAAALGLAIFLDKLGKRATAIYSGKTPNALEFLKPSETFETSADVLQDFVIALNKDKADHLRYKLDGDYVKIYITPYKSKVSKEDLTFSYGDYNVDLVLALDVANGVDLDSALREHGRIMHDAVIVDITTGNPGKLGEIEWSDKTASSVSEMVAKLLYGVSKDKIEKDEATAFLTGVVAATNRFSNAKTTPETMQISSLLMRSGANQQLVSQNITPDIDNELAERINLSNDKPKAEAADAKTEKKAAAEETKAEDEEKVEAKSAAEDETETASVKEDEAETASVKEDEAETSETKDKSEGEVAEKSADAEAAEESADAEATEEPAEEETDPTQLSVTHEKKIDSDLKLDEPTEEKTEATESSEVEDSAETLATETKIEEHEKTDASETSESSEEIAKIDTLETESTEEVKTDTLEEPKTETPAEEPDSPDLLDDLKKAAEGLSGTGDLSAETKTEEENSSGFLEVNNDDKSETETDTPESDQGPTPEEEGLMRAGPEKVLQPTEEISTETIEEESHKFSDMMDAALGEVSGPMNDAAPTQTIASPLGDAPAAQPTAGPLGAAPQATSGADLPPVVSVTSPTLGENPAVVAAPQVATNPEINGVPEMNFTPPADAEILPPPPVPVMDIGAPGSMPPETVPTPTIPVPDSTATATAAPATSDPAANPGAFQIPGM